MNPAISVMKKISKNIFGRSAALQQIGKQLRIDLLAVQVPAVCDSFGLSLGGDREFQIDEDGAVLYDLAPHFIIIVCVDVLV